MHQPVRRARLSSHQEMRSTTMQAHEGSIQSAPKRTSWNKGKIIGAKPPLWPKHVWSIRTKLHIEGRILELALFNLAIDSKLRGCDVVALKVEEVAPNGHAVARGTVRQKKTGRPGRFELTDHTRDAVDAYLKLAGKTGRNVTNFCLRAPGGLERA